MEKLGNKEILFFLDEEQITNDQGEKLDFIDHPYLLDIYDDFTPKQAVLKAAQIGFSTTANIKALWLAKNKGMDIIYSLPSAADIKDFVSGKTNRLIDNNPIFQQWTIDKDSIEQKRVGSNVIYFKGTWTERAAIATPADLYISDETDRSKQEIVSQFRTRLQHSKYGWEWYFSNPSAPGHGVDKYWQESDQKHWFVKCEACNEWQYLTMANIIGTPPFYGCTKCGKELDRRNGKWVKKFQGKETSGYWISLLIAPTKNAQYVLNKKKEYTEGQFANFVLGQPYIGKNSVLTRQMFLQNLVETVNPQVTRPIIGIDTGNDINLVVGNAHGVFYAHKSPEYDVARNLMKRWPNAMCIIDGGGDFRGAKSFREEFPNRVFLCYFGKDRKNDELIRWKDDDGTVVADRNKLLQLVIDEFIEKRMPVYGTENDWLDVMNEFLGMYRTEELSDVGPPVFEWHKPSTGRCDYPFALAYMRVGLDRYAELGSTFHSPTNDSFAFTGYEAKADGTAWIPKR
jgi:hypothetical protein